MMMIIDLMLLKISLQMHINCDDKSAKQKKLQLVESSWSVMQI
jgi:hypothetical protein